MLDEATVTTILSRRFPLARRADIDDAARDVVLLELLTDDRVVVWEDSLRNRQDPTFAYVFGAASPRLDS